MSVNAVNFKGTKGQSNNLGLYAIGSAGGFALGGLAMKDEITVQKAFEMKPGEFKLSTEELSEGEQTALKDAKAVMGSREQISQKAAADAEGIVKDLFAGKEEISVKEYLKYSSCVTDNKGKKVPKTIEEFEQMANETLKELGEKTKQLTEDIEAKRKAVGEATTPEAKAAAEKALREAEENLVKHQKLLQEAEVTIKKQTELLKTAKNGKLSKQAVTEFTSWFTEMKAKTTAMDKLGKAFEVLKGKLPKKFSVKNGLIGGGIALGLALLFSAMQPNDA